MKAVSSPRLAPGCHLMQVAMVITKSRTGIFTLKEEKNKDRDGKRKASEKAMFICLVIEAKSLHMMWMKVFVKEKKI